MIVSSAIEKMIAFYQGNLHDINHFLSLPKPLESRKGWMVKRS